MQPTQYKNPTTPFGKFWLKHFLIINQCMHEGYRNTFFHVNTENILKERKTSPTLLHKKSSNENNAREKTSPKTLEAYYNGIRKYPPSHKSFKHTGRNKLHKNIIPREK
jgi:hypothetical protein